jgi:hypothetical protein
VVPLTTLALAFAGLLAYGWWATGLTPFSAGATVAVVGAGGVAMVVGARLSPRPAPPLPTVRDLLPWAILLAALAGWQLIAYVQEPRSEHPTLSSMGNGLLDTHSARAVAFAAWALIGARLARR